LSEDKVDRWFKETLLLLLGYALGKRRKNDNYLGCLSSGCSLVFWLIVAVFVYQTCFEKRRSGETAQSSCPNSETRWPRGGTNVRAARSTTSKVITRLEPGESIHVDSLSQGWYLVCIGPYRLGYVAANLLDTVPHKTR